jgi:hypothetical protein
LGALAEVDGVSAGTDVFASAIEAKRKRQQRVMVIMDRMGPLLLFVIWNGIMACCSAKE